MIRNAIEAHICAQYASDRFDANWKALWNKLAEGYREALGLELYDFRHLHLEYTLEAQVTVVK